MEDVPIPSEPQGMSPEQRAAAFDAWSANHPVTKPQSDYAVSREAKYEGRE